MEYANGGEVRANTGILGKFPPKSIFSALSSTASHPLCYFSIFWQKGGETAPFSRTSRVSSRAFCNIWLERFWVSGTEQLRARVTASAACRERLAGDLLLPFCYFFPFFLFLPPKSSFSTSRGSASSRRTGLASTGPKSSPPWSTCTPGTWSTGTSRYPKSQF